MSFPTPLFQIPQQSISRTQGLYFPNISRTTTFFSSPLPPPWSKSNSSLSLLVSHIHPSTCFWLILCPQYISNPSLFSVSTPTTPMLLHQLGDCHLASQWGSLIHPCPPHRLISTQWCPSGAHFTPSDCQSPRDARKTPRDLLPPHFPPLSQALGYFWNRQDVSLTSCNPFTVCLLPHHPTKTERRLVHSRCPKKNLL